MTFQLDKKSLSEQDICTKFITPALEKAGWDKMLQIREQFYFTKGQILVRGNLLSRKEGYRADYILYYKPNMPIAVIEAKNNNYSVGEGMQQALEYAEMLEVPFVFSSNGDAFVFHDKTRISKELETNLSLDQFPSPDLLWQRYREWKGFSQSTEDIVLQDYHDDGQGKTPRYYQMNAINKTLEAVTLAKNRILLVMATGTGKTYTDLPPKFCTVLFNFFCIKQHRIPVQML